uniref:CBM-cenC domain-containing protein n=1 Tax=Gracilinema caldarium TaxID=215591 RepID=A0A7C3I683_9SPIR
MKGNKRQYFFFLALALVASLALVGCPSPTSSDGSGDTGGGDVATDNAKISFENWDGVWAYNPGDALTKDDSQSSASKDTVVFKNGSASLKISGTIQEDKYSTTKEFGMRLKAATILNVANIDVLSKVISLWVYVPADAENDAIQIALQDSSYQQAISNAVSLTKGSWTQVFFKLLSAGDSDNTKYTDRPCLVTVSDASGSTIVSQGAYTGETFKQDQITEIEIRSLNGTIGNAAYVNIDSIDWN